MVVVQGAVPVAPDDTEASLTARILSVEHVIYPLAIGLFAEGRLHVAGRFVHIDGPRPSAPPPLVVW